MVTFAPFTPAHLNSVWPTHFPPHSLLSFQLSPLISACLSDPACCSCTETLEITPGVREVWTLSSQRSVYEGLLNSQHWHSLWPFLFPHLSSSFFACTDYNGFWDLFSFSPSSLNCLFFLIHPKLLGQLENTGPPPAQKEMISSLPTVCISEEQTGSDKTHPDLSCEKKDSDSASMQLILHSDK